ncbi:MAG: hypothetical protein PHE53_11570, partial [Thermoguttaceae bacterium]|nr:hypothetical protein [Thermoguttaceae bacterium]
MRKSISRNQWIMDVVGTVLIGIPVLLWTLHGAFPWGTNTAWTQEVGGPNGNVVSTENAADAEPSESPATEATLATLPSSEGSPEAADLITRMMEIPYVGTSTGRAISLQESLQGIRDQEGTRRVVRAYWRTLESICRFRTLAEHAERLRRFRPQPDDLAMIQYLRNDVEKQVRLASDTLYRDQMTLLGSMVSTKQVSRGNRTTTEEITNAALPLPSDTPLTGGYETLFDRFYRNSRGTLSARARLLHYLLPLHREAIERRAEQVAAAEYVLQDAVDAYTNGQTSVQTLLWATNESLRSREEFITSVFNYNHDIADYIFMVAPEMTGTAIVPRLIRSQTLGTSNRLGLNLRSDGTISLPPSRFDATPHTVAKPVDAANPNDMADAAKSTETVHPDEAAKLTSVANPTETNKPTEAAKLTGTAALPSESVAGPLMESAHAAAKPNAQASEPKPSEPAKPLVPASSPIFAEEVAPRLSLPESIEPSKTDNEAEVPAAKTETAEESSELPAAETGEPSTNSESDTEDTENGVSYCPSVPVWLTAMQEELLPPALSETPPALSETPPASSETPPASSETPPALSETPPALSETPPALGETPPALGETPPALGETPPALSETPPASGAT